MFMSEYYHSIDEKGRIIVPSKYREQLGDTFVLTQGLDGCLYVYPNEEWETFVAELGKLPSNMEGRKIQRYFLAGAVFCEVDKQGRFLIPGKLRQRVGLEREVVFVGVLNKIEIWSKERWEANDSYENMDEIAERMSVYDIKF